MITVLRLGHRAGRDPRISTHCALVARAFGADSFIYSGEHDSGLESSVRDIVRNWGGKFTIRHDPNWRSVIKGFRGMKVHLTVYGMPLKKKLRQMSGSRDLLIIIGGQKVPAEVYQLSDMNVSVTSQPHSEVAALAVCLHGLLGDTEPARRFAGARIRVIPAESGKHTEKGEQK